MLLRNVTLFIKVLKIKDLRKRKVSIISHSFHELCAPSILTMYSLSLSTMMLTHIMLMLCPFCEVHVRIYAKKMLLLASELNECLFLTYCACHREEITRTNIAT
jgi:hypothetical protein